MQQGVKRLGVRLGQWLREQVRGSENKGKGWQGSIEQDGKGQEKQGQGSRKQGIMKTWSKDQEKGMGQKKRGKRSRKTLAL